ncbi:MAG: O-acetyl-ADP-ribose deacetylase (regulator of RNase III) [Patiriisocius sp.]|jgi:O-acetyl-ADP-ribose deacetylase (regulator of RNase III)
MRLELHFGDITEYKADCIVNAARNSLLGGGGVDGAIHNAAGSELKEFCKTLGGCKVGEAKLSPAFNLPSKFIIHTVGPRFLFKSEEEIQDLKNCYSNSLKIANQKKYETLVFSNISTGVYGFPKDLAAKYSFEVISDFLMGNEYPKKVVLCCYDIENLQLYSNIVKENL